MVEHLLDLSGIGRNRMQVSWVSSAEGQAFANYVTQFSEQTRQLGPFDPDEHKRPLAAVEETLNSSRIRWLMGVDRQITERENVYHEKMDPEEYTRILHKAIEEEYEKAMILEVIKEGPQLVREISATIGLPKQRVSFWLNQLKNSGQAQIASLEENTPKFVSLAAA